MLIRRCLICDNLIGFKKYICDECKEKLDRDKFDSFISRCNVCGYPKLNKLYSCSFCNGKKSDYKIFSISDYKASFSKDILFDFKFSNNKKLKFVFAQLLNDFLKDHNIVNDCIIVPVPCSKKSIKTRGWDHMKEVTKVLHNKYRYKYLFLLENVSNKEQQKN